MINNNRKYSIDKKKYPFRRVEIRVLNGPEKLIRSVYVFNGQR